jgi:prepilin-type processing-associated H-X9-DG protein
MPTAVFVIVLIAAILFIVTVCGGILLALLLPAIQSSREYARQVACKTDLHNIHMALEAYHIENDHYPPAYTVDENGQRLHSWRTLLLPYLGHQELYEQIRLDEPWDSPHNRQFSDAGIKAYQCPSAGDDEKAFTNYVVIDGPEMIFRGSTPTRKQQIKNGLAQTVLVAETADTDIHWMEPRDLDFEKMVFRVNGSPDDVSSHHPGGVNAVMADGQVRFFSDTLDPMVWRALLTPSGPREEFRLEFPF